MSEAAVSNPTVQLQGPQALGDLVRDSRTKGTPIVDYGVGHNDLGHPPPAGHVRLVQQGDVIEHYERDMTVRAAAGITIGNLQAALSARNQFAPIDADDDLTLGEVINHNVYGPLRVSYGAMRDLLLGLRYIDGKAHDIHVGGRTVKNVAGYDITRFMVGGLGEYGIIYEATFRTYVIPQQVKAVAITMSDPTWLDANVSKLMVTPAAPSVLSETFESDRWCAHIAYLGTEQSCTIQHQALKQRLAENTGVTIEAASDESFESFTRSQTTSRAWQRTASAVVKIIVPPAKTGAVCQQLPPVSDAHIHALPVHGCIFMGGNLDIEAAGALDQQIDRIIEPIGGFRVWYKRPDESIVPFAPPQPDWPLLEKLKQVMDPDLLLNPGRFVDVAVKSSQR